MSLHVSKGSCRIDSSAVGSVGVHARICGIVYVGVHTHTQQAFGLISDSFVLFLLLIERCHSYVNSQPPSMRKGSQPSGSVHHRHTHERLDGHDGVVQVQQAGSQ
jgi:hypothetical protein